MMRVLFGAAAVVAMMTGSASAANMMSSEALPADNSANGGAPMVSGAAPGVTAVAPGVTTVEPVENAYPVSDGDAVAVIDGDGHPASNMVMEGNTSPVVNGDQQPGAADAPMYEPEVVAPVQPTQSPFLGG